MSAYEAKKLAQLAQGQAIAAVNEIQRKPGVKSAQDHYDENLALAIANLSQAFVELAK